MSQIIDADALQACAAEIRPRVCSPVIIAEENLDARIECLVLNRPHLRRLFDKLAGGVA